MTKWSLTLARELKNADFGDPRLSKRLQTIAADLAERPDQSIPKASVQASKTKAAYRFFSNESIDLSKMLEPHVQETIARCVDDVILAIHDTTFLNFTQHKATKGLGQIGTHASLLGMAAHTAVAMSPTGNVLGLLAQKVWVRQQRMPKDEASAARRKRSRESERWGQLVDAIAQRNITARIIHVMDREGDIYEALEKVSAPGQSYVIRASQDRRIQGEEARLFELVHGSEDLGTFQLRVPARAGRPERTAHLTVRSVGATIRPPKGLSRTQGIAVGIVLVTETSPPEGIEGLEWILLTGEPHATLEDCLRVVGYYAKRWAIEDFHMILKTGCRIEERQLQSREALEAFLGLADVISTMLLRLRYLARNGSAHPASTVLTPRQLLILSKLFPKLGRNPTAQEALRAVAMRGGFLARKSDGNPGWRTLWRGMHDLLVMEMGFELASDLLR